MATHSNILAWEVPWTEEPGGLQSMDNNRFGHDLATKQQSEDYNIVTKKEKRIGWLSQSPFMESKVSEPERTLGVLDSNHTAAA